MIQQQTEDVHNENLSLDPDEIPNENLIPNVFSLPNPPPDNQRTEHELDPNTLKVQGTQHPTQSSSILTTTNTDITQQSIQPPHISPRNCDSPSPIESNTYTSSSSYNQQGPSSQFLRMRLTLVNNLVSNHLQLKNTNSL